MKTNVRTQKADAAAKTPKVSCKMTINEEFNGVELTFSAKPSTKVRNTLKAVGFKWHNQKQVWYAKRTNKAAMTLAESLCKRGAKSEPSAPKPKAGSPSKKAKVVAEAKAEPSVSSKPKKASPKAKKAEAEPLKSIHFEGKIRNSKGVATKSLAKAINETEGLVAEFDREWLWVSGETKPFRESLKALGFKFSGKREAWYLMA